MATFKHDDAIRRIGVGGKVAMEMGIWPPDTVISRVQIVEECSKQGLDIYARFLCFGTNFPAGLGLSRADPHT